MWLELFLLDNVLMNALILRAAASMCATKTIFLRTLAFSLGGAVYATVAFYIPLLGALPFKLLTGLIMALALKTKSVRAYLLHALCLFLSAFLIGGLCVCLALAGGGGLKNGLLFASIPLRVALITAFIGAFLPRALRVLLWRNARAASHVRLKLCHKGKEYNLNGLVDTGNLVVEPLSAMPVVLFYATEFPTVEGCPISVCGASGEACFLNAFKPDALYALESGESLAAFAALSPSPLKGAEALVPPAALHV